jgi:hypothetical protein
VERARRDGDDRMAYCSERRDAVAPRVPRLIIEVDNPVASLAIEQDGTAVVPQSYGVPLAVDPGTIVVVVKRGERELARKQIEIAEASTATVSFDLAAIERDKPPPPVPAPDAVETRPQEPKEPYDPTHRNVGIIIGSIGLAATLTAGALEIAALVRKGDANESDACVNGHCTPNGIDIANQAKTLAEVGQWLGIAGLATLAVGVTVFLTAPPEDDDGEGVSQRPSIWLGPLPRAPGLALGGAF